MSGLSFDSILELVIKMIPLKTVSATIIKYLTDKDDEYVNKFVDFIFDYVDKIASENIPGYQKADKVRKVAKETFNDLADWIINLAIELAVAELKKV